ncbi:hypothetical protein CesoFtcFv8_026624 [Champsocephalus esox]|uniref:Uncharacterized protein n=1 Tax=Champsocephalus esox TaxID=159716 RepID=A0AAN8AZI5_9TELE|nr:hypothetical protein CesoFtcFv8_026624 [Champsocephalus esox]
MDSAESASLPRGEESQSGVSARAGQRVDARDAPGELRHSHRVGSESINTHLSEGCKHVEHWSHAARGCPDGMFGLVRDFQMGKSFTRLQVKRSRWHA